MRGCLKIIVAILVIVGLVVLVCIGWGYAQSVYEYPGMCELPGYHCTIVFPNGETLIIEGGEQPSAVVIPPGGDVRPSATAPVVVVTPTPTSGSAGSTGSDCAYRLPDGSLRPGCGHGD